MLFQEAVSNPFIAIFGKGVWGHSLFLLEMVNKLCIKAFFVPQIPGPLSEMHGTEYVAGNTHPEQTCYSFSSTAKPNLSSSARPLLPFFSLFLSSLPVLLNFPPEATPTSCSQHIFSTILPEKRSRELGNAFESKG